MQNNEYCINEYVIQYKYIILEQIKLFDDK